MKCHVCYGEHPGVSCYWANQGKTPADKRPGGKTFERSDGRLGCDECCTGMITQDECNHHWRRESCPYCLGSGTPLEVKST